MKTSHSTAESLRLFVRDKLRDDHPHMKSAKAEEIARRCKLFFMKQMETASVISPLPHSAATADISQLAGDGRAQS